MSKIFFSSKIPFIAIVLLCLIIFISHTLYVLKTNQLPEMDEQHYMYMASGFYKILQHPALDSPIKMIELLPFRQPGYSLIILPFLLVFGLHDAYRIALWINGLLYVATIIGVYAIGKEFFKKYIAVIAAYIFAFYGWSLFYLHFTYSETAATCFVVLSFLFLIKSKFFQNRKNSILFGIFFGFGLLVRWVTPIFIIGPLLYVMYKAVKAKKQKKYAIKNITIAFIIVLAIAGLPYVLNYKTFFGDYFNSQLLGGPIWNTVPLSHQKHFSFWAAAYYFKVFEQLTFPLFVLFLSGLILGIIKKTRTRIILLSLLAPYLLFSFGTVIKDDRYIVPIYPFLALISASVIDYIKIQKAKIGFVTLIIILSFGNFLGASWGIGPLGQKGLMSISIPLPVGHPRLIHLTTIVWPPKKDESRAQEIIDFIERDSKKNHINNPSVIELFSYHTVDLGMYAINTYERMEPIFVQNFVGMEINDVSKNALFVTEAINKASYILTKNRVQTDSYFPPNNYPLLQKTIYAVKNLSNSPLQFFTKVTTVAVPADGSTVIIYRKAKPIPADVLRDFQSNLIEEFEKK